MSAVRLLRPLQTNGPLSKDTDSTNRTGALLALLQENDRQLQVCGMNKCVV